MSVFILAFVLFVILVINLPYAEIIRCRVVESHYGWCVQCQKKFWPFWIRISFYHDDKDYIQRLHKSLVRTIVLEKCAKQR